MLDVAGGYLGGLSADAAPALARLPPGLRTYALASLRTRLDEDDDGLLGFNLVRARARDVLS